MEIKVINKSNNPLPTYSTEYSSGLDLRANLDNNFDTAYRGEIKIILINLSNEDFTIHHGDKIAQMVIAKFEKADLKIVDSLSETVRSDGGFGHSGI